MVTVTPASTFEKVLELLVSKGLHRVYVVDESGHAISIITLTDVLRAVTRPARVAGPVSAPVYADDDEDEDDDDEDDEDNDDDEDMKEASGAVEGA